MPDVPVISIDENIEKATNSLAETLSDEISLINVYPPENSDGMDIAPEFLESVHFLEQKNRFLRSNKNESPTCGMEMWYDNNHIKFMFYTPSKELEQEYRQQLRGYYPECDISQQTPNEGMFIRSKTDRPEAAAVMQFQVKEHYFMPISSPVSEENELNSDPYQRIVNEIDTKDDTRAILQVLYKPATYDWTDCQHTTLETKAKQIQNKGGFKTRYWGFKIDEVDDPGIFEGAASEMRARINKPAFFVNIRLAVICSGETEKEARKKAKSRGSAIVNTLEHLYETRAEQRLVPKEYRVNKERNARETLVNMIERNGNYMRQPKNIHEILWHKITPNHDIIILTAGELAGLVHLPSKDELNTGAITFKSDMVQGEVPPDVEDFEPVPKEQRKGYTDEEIPDLDVPNDESETEENSDSDGNPSLSVDDW